MYRMDPGGIDTRVFAMEEAESADKDGWKLSFGELKKPEELGSNEAEILNSKNAIANYCRDWNMHLNLHLLRGKIGKKNILGLYERQLKTRPNMKMSLDAMKRDFERKARKVGIWMGDE